MSNLRFKVVESAFEKKATDVNIPAERPADYFGQLVFNREKMFKYLPEKIYNKLIDCIDNAMPLDRDTADGVAAGMKQWAMVWKVILTVKAHQRSAVRSANKWRRSIARLWMTVRWLGVVVH